MTTPRAGTVEKAVRAELRRLKASMTTDGSAALAVALARQIDSARGAVAAAAAAAQLRLLLDDLRKIAAQKPPVKDEIAELRSDELAARRRAAG